MRAAPELVANRYRLRESLGIGGMGQVWRAWDETLVRDVAVKQIILPPELIERERDSVKARTLREARAAARLSHPNVVRVYDVLEADGQPWIVMEYVPSRSLHEVIHADGPLPPQRVAEIGLQVLGALQAAHRAGVQHRDIKPGNVLLTDNGRVVLTDFGIAQIEGEGYVTRSGLVLGSPEYIAPERARNGIAGPEADLWSLGATLYTAVEGRAPFHRPTAIATLTALALEDPDPTTNAGVLDPALRALLRKDPKARADVAEAERLLRRAADGGARTRRRWSFLPAPRRPEGLSGGVAAVTPARMAPPTPAARPAQAAPPAPAVGRAVAPVADVGTPAVEPATTVVPAARTGSEGEPGREVAVEPEVESGLVAEAASESAAVPAAVPEASVEPETVPDALAEPDTAPEPVLVPEATAEPESTTEAEPAAELEPDAEPEPAVEPEPAAEAETKVEPLLIAEAAVEPDAVAPEAPADPVAADEPRTKVQRAVPPPPGRKRTWAGATRQNTLVTASVAVVLLIGLVILLVANPGSNRKAATTAGTLPSAAPQTTTPAAPSPSAGAGRPAATSPATGTNGGKALPALPDGWFDYHDPTGFAVYVPVGWRHSVEHGMVYFRDSASGRVLGIDQTNQPKSDPVADWEANEAARVPHDFPGYQRIKIAPVDYFVKAADWEFTYDTGSVRAHVNNRGAVISAHKAYGFYWQTPDAQWTADLPELQLVFDSFRPAAS